MRQYLRVAALLAVWMPVQSNSQTSQTSAKLNCQTGPVKKSYGGAKWLAYSCDDNRTVVIMAAPNTPAAPFYFMFSLQQGHYQLTGEGTGNQKATDAAYQDLRALAEKEIVALIAETKPH